ncbi:metallophosphoesterase family protein [Cohnella suwonensis]|uniref:Metallophosphoesterase family protein n=1 Tax=Cohnella suwonensis TaxID=696072 RepID=A0ABW0M0S2_9BACL
MGKQLSFRKDGSFTIVQFTDVHWKNGDEKDARTKALMTRVIADEKPDLIVFTGDVVESLHCSDPYRSFKDAVDVAERSGIPWAAVFGNHDSEGATSREELMKVQTGLAGSIAEAGPPDIGGVGNFARTVAGRDGFPAAALYFIDSGAYSELPNVPGYGWFRRGQSDWLLKEARALQAGHGGRPIPSLAFFHIPLPEYREAWDEQICRGRRYEKVQSPRLNTGMFTALAQAGGVMGTFCGHDHINDYEGTLHGIRLCYGRATGYNTYGRWRFRRGARVIRMREGEESFETWLRLDNGAKVEKPRKHSPNRFSKA